MEVAAPRGRRTAPAVALASVEAGERCALSTPGAGGSAPQDYLDALPIAAAVVCVSTYGATYVDASNEHFRRIGGWDSTILETGPIAAALTDFLLSQDAARQFESNDGQPVGGRHFTVRLARLKPRPGASKRCLVSLIDMTAQVETEKNLRAEMLRDSLTGLPNRLRFTERVEEVLQDESFRERSYAVVAVDMNRFSRINESMGAMVGDELLISFARRLYSALRAGDILARTGGDEFGILMRLDRGIAEALQLAERVKGVLAAPFRLSDLEIRVDCAVGCALVTRKAQLADEILRNGQFGLKQSKVTGRPEVYEPQQAKAALRRFSLETELRRAIDRDELTLAYQPLIDLATGAVSGFEALARWHHEERGAIPPAEFIAVAEESGLILPLGRWAIDSAIRTLAAWDAKAGKPLPFHVAVNVSPIQIARDDISAPIAEALRANGLSGSRLTLELTESAILVDPEAARRSLEDLKALDARIAMDDFGTGYTSLAHLQRLPIDVLKIDASFVSRMLHDRDSSAIVLAILSLADALGMETTAEGIESADLADALSALGCSHGQGFHFAAPLAPDAAFDYWLPRSA